MSGSTLWDVYGTSRAEMTIFESDGRKCANSLVFFGVVCVSVDPHQGS